MTLDTGKGKEKAQNNSNMVEMETNKSRLKQFFHQPCLSSINAMNSLTIKNRRPHLTPSDPHSMSSLFHLYLACQQHISVSTATTTLLPNLLYWCVNQYTILWTRQFPYKPVISLLNIQCDHFTLFKNLQFSCYLE